MPAAGRRRGLGEPASWLWALPGVSVILSRELALKPESWRRGARADRGLVPMEGTGARELVLAPPSERWAVLAAGFQAEPFSGNRMHPSASAERATGLC